MRLTWRDLAATIVLLAILAMYVLHLHGSTGWLLSSTRGTTAAVLVLGAVGCALGRAEDLYREDRTLDTAVLAVGLSALGALALFAGVIGLVTGESLALTLLVAYVAALWMIATLRHATVGPDEVERLYAPEPGPENHETIERRPAHSGDTR